MKIVDVFISSLKNKAIEGRLPARFDYLEQYGPLAKPPAFEHLGDKIYYIRLSFGKLEIRIFYFFDGKKIILTHGFLKKTPKAPLRRSLGRKRFTQSISDSSLKIGFTLPERMLPGNSSPQNKFVYTLE
ncbi:MAG: type II toxin-antitoxin system RelE/ParE family toxin [Elusimicrobiota bacterium]|nr:type II toxin-antitoxin system RelE/ParE family toxin [Elusimicrobiota bacterium]